MMYDMAVVQGKLAQGVALRGHAMQLQQQGFRYPLSGVSAYLVQMRASNWWVEGHQVTPMKRRSFTPSPARPFTGSLRVLTLA